MASDNCDPVWRSVCSASRSRVLKHKDQESFRAVANTESQTPEEEIDTHSSAREFAKTKENFSHSVSEPDVEEQIKTQESVSYSSTGGIAVGYRDSLCECDPITRSWSRKKRLA
jgi:hypothetical protein